jgi:chemotaxis regulatin CheY-phosphate phosphatase CheZ
MDRLKAVRAELATLDAAKIASQRIGQARLELEALLAQALVSTDTIMSAAEAIAAIAQENPADSEAIIAERVADIFVACAFHDLTAQRARRLKQHLDQIETGLARFGQTLGALGTPEPSTSESDTLAAGPALPGTGNDQDAVDHLLALLNNP